MRPAVRTGKTTIRNGWPSWRQDSHPSCRIEQVITLGGPVNAQPIQPTNQLRKALRRALPHASSLPPSSKISLAQARRSAIDEDGGCVRAPRAHAGAMLHGQHPPALITSLALVPFTTLLHCTFYRALLPPIIGEGTASFNIAR